MTQQQQQQGQQKRDLLRYTLTIRSIMLLWKVASLMVVVSALTVIGVGADAARENKPLDGAEEPERAFLDMTGLTDKEVRRSTC